MKNFYILSLLLAALAVQGCASGRSSSAYDRDQARRAHDVMMGMIEDIRSVKIEGTSGVVGTTAGTAVGAIGGGAVGGGRGSHIAAVIGGLIGGLVGAAAEEGYTQRDGWELIVRQDDGRVISVVQEVRHDEIFKIGSRVRVITDPNGVARVANISYSPQSIQAPPLTGYLQNPS